MDDSDRLSKIEAVIAPVIHDHGLTLVELEWRRQGHRCALRVFVDKQGGVGVDDCQRLSREAGDVLEVSRLIPESYDLEVSSPGLDRALRTEREFRWACGRVMRCWVRQPVMGQTEVRGRLVDVSRDRLVVETDSGMVGVPRAVITKARLDADVPWARQRS
jgi:ribosome maturation factor RimP